MGSSLFGRMGWCLALLQACATSLDRDTLERHPPLDLEVRETEVIERSGEAPAWFSAASDGAIIGGGSAAFLAEAEARARADAAEQARQSLALDVEAEFESVETHRTGEHDAQSVRSEVRVRAHGVEIEPRFLDLYWERVRVPATDETVVRAYVLARIDEADLSLARRRRMEAKMRASGRRIVLIELDAKSAEPMGRAVQSDLIRRLAPHPGIAPVAEAASEPDVRIVFSLSIRSDELRLAWRLEGGQEMALVGRSTEVFELEDRLATAVGALLAGDAGTARVQKD